MIKVKKKGFSKTKKRRNIANYFRLQKTILKMQNELRK